MGALRFLRDWQHGPERSLGRLSILGRLGGRPFVRDYRNRIHFWSHMGSADYGCANGGCGALLPRHAGDVRLSRQSGGNVGDVSGFGHRRLHLGVPADFSNVAFARFSMTTFSNTAGAVDAPITFLFAFLSQCRRATDQHR